MEIIIPDYVKKGAPWSISKAGVVEKCSLQYHYKYSLKIAEQVTFSNSLLGKAVHRVLELSLEGLVTLEKAFQMARLEFTLTETETEQLLIFRGSCQKFVKKMNDFKAKHGVREVLLEKKLAVTAEGTKAAYFGKDCLLRGVIDYVLITADNYAIVIDHKTGNQQPIEKYDTQLKSYCVLMLANYPQLKGVQTAVNFAMNDELLWNKMILAEDIKEKYVPWMRDYLAKATAPLALPPVGLKSSACDWCAYGPKSTTPVCTLYGGTGQAPVTPD